MKKAIIYVRGNKTEMQEVMCRIYAADMGYKVLFVTTDIEAVNGCDILLITNASRISRNSFKYYETVNELKAKGIEVVSISSQKNTDECISLARSIFANNCK